MEHAAFSKRLFIKEQYSCKKQNNYGQFPVESWRWKQTIISTTHVIKFLVIKETASDSAFQAAN